MVKGDKMKVTISRKANFNAAHRLHNNHWPDEKNRQIFGKCNNPNYHGHNYELIVSVTGEIDPDTGYVIDTKRLHEIIEEEVLERFDHKNLNLDTKEFKNINPTVENIAVVIYQLLLPRMDADKTIKITLYETERNYVEYAGE
jgi:6-pyruvoyltetrahydropterin/6-carboxytetrahydropterin synthase